MRILYFLFPAKLQASTAYLSCAKPFPSLLLGNKVKLDLLNFSSAFFFVRKYHVCLQNAAVVPNNKIINVTCMLWWYQASVAHQALGLTPTVPIEMVT